METSPHFVTVVTIARRDSAKVLSVFPDDARGARAADEAARGWRSDGIPVMVVTAVVEGGGVYPATFPDLVPAPGGGWRRFLRPL